MLAEANRRLELSYANYQSLPKSIGDVPAWQLLELAEQNAGRAETLPSNAAVRFHEAAGSAYVEAALVLEDPSNEHIDGRLALIEAAEEHLRTFADGEYQLIEHGARDPDDQTDWRRAELQCEFMNLYRDIICGEVTTETKRELLAALMRHRTYAEQLTKMSAPKQARGLVRELDVLHEIWQQYQSTGDAVAFPSTSRGGQGISRPNETHDIVLARQSHDGATWSFEGVEIKSGRGFTKESLIRYRSAIVRVGNDGTISTYDALSA